MHRDNLEPYQSPRHKHILIEPHPAHSSPNEKKGGYNVTSWRFRCTLCGDCGIGWKAEISAINQGGDHLATRHEGDT